MRADLGGELHKRVADDLGISPRLFYRERRAIRLFVARAVANHVRREVERRAIALDPFEMAFNRARSLYEMGAVRASIDQLDAMLAASSEPSRRVRVWSALVARLAQNGRALDARKRFAESYREFASDFATHVGATESILLWNEGCETEAAALNERVFPALDALAHTTDRGLRDFALESYLVGQLPLAWLANLASVRAVLERARAIVREEQPASLLRLIFLSEHGSLLMHERRATEEVRDLFTQAATLAQKEGLQEHYVMTVLLMTLLEERSGDPSRALASVRDLLAVVDGVGSVGVRRKAFLRAAALEVQYGNARRGIAFAKRVHDNGHGMTFHGAQAGWLEGEGYLRLGKIDRARAVFTELCDRGLPAIFHGKALMSLAKIDAHDGRAGEAREHLTDGLRLIESSGMLASLGLAHRDAAQITGDPKHLARAQELIGNEFKGT